MIRLAHILAMWALWASPALLTAAQEPDPKQLIQLMARYREYRSAFDRYQFTTSPDVLGKPTTNFWIAQLAAMDASFMGRPNDALLYFPSVTLPPKSLPDPEHFKAVDAREWVIAKASNYGIVMINEAHHLPQTRLLTLSLLKPLRSAGFRYLALETLVNNGKNPIPAGYPEVDSGGYTNEPVMAELVREAIRLGYTLVPYEATDEEAAQVATRERAQARNLEKFLSNHPGAKLLVHAGYAHIAKTDAVTIAGARTMATYLTMDTNASVLSVDQTSLIPMSKASHDAIDTQSRLNKDFSVSAPVVLLGLKDEIAWSSKPKAYDATVLLPTSPADVIRPDWLSLGGIRRKVYLGIGACANRFPCLVQAFMMGESSRAIAADQFVALLPSEALTPLFLRDGAYRLRYTTQHGQIVSERSIDVPYRMGELPPERLP